MSCFENDKWESDSPCGVWFHAIMRWVIKGLKGVIMVFLWCSVYGIICTCDAHICACWNIQNTKGLLGIRIGLYQVTIYRHFLSVSSNNNKYKTQQIYFKTAQNSYIHICYLFYNVLNQIILIIIPSAVCGKGIYNWKLEKGEG